MLSAKNISFHQVDGPHFKDISLKLNKGSISCIIGPNGSGKSTLLRALSGIIPLQAGQISFDSININKLSRKDFAKYVAYLPQNIQNAPLTVKEVLIMGRTPYIKFIPSKKDYALVDEMLEQLNISTWKDRYLDELSGGERQKVFLAKVLVQQTPIILLDEPTNNLDIYYQLEFYNIIKKLALEQNKIILIAEHNLNLATQFSQQLLIMHKYQLVKQGDVSEIFNKQMLKDIYKIDANVQNFDNIPYFLCTKDTKIL